MSSWFSNLASTATSLAGKVKESMPVLDNETLQKLTLTTPELREARQKIIDEELQPIKEELSETTLDAKQESDDLAIKEEDE